LESAYHKSSFKLAGNLLHKPKDLALPLHDSVTDLANHFNNFFVEKIVNIGDGLQSVALNINSAQDTSKLTSTHSILQHPLTKPPVLCNFDPTSKDEIRKLIMCSKTTQCSLDPIPTRLLKDCIVALLPILTRIVNLSLSQGTMPMGLKKALVSPLLKKASLAVKIKKIFRPVSNLAYLSKLIERVIAI
jgi:hypothetical protein